MNLTLAEVRDLPLAAALFDWDGAQIAATPDWQGGGAGTVLFGLRAMRLAVATAPPDPAAAAVLDLLLAELSATAASLHGPQRLQVGMLAASLHLVAGRRVSTSGTSHHVIDMAAAGISARTALRLRVDGRPSFPVQAPEVAALCLVQLAVNAERHTRTSEVRLLQEAGAFHLVWAGHAGCAEIVTSRRHLDRERWGMGFCRVAADTLGAAVIPLADRGDGTVGATLELGLNDLALPLAVIRGHRVLKATRTWDEETSSVPGATVEPGSRIAVCLEAAAARPGRVVTHDGWCARLVGDRCWIAIPPDDIVDRARDVLDGMVHERALWEGVSEPHQSRVFALASLLAARLGTALPRVPAGVWNQRMARLAAQLGIPMPAARFRGLGALDPRVVAYLAAEVGAGITTRGDELVLRVRPGLEADPRLSDLVHVEDGVRLS
ncbi:MAG TPA: hypothetical protein VEK76_07080 [Candidatus Binatia bacterium]|nr:hypothetical protein [Candidatus Binatia bacterium]